MWSNKINEAFKLLEEIRDLLKEIRDKSGS